jgi:hypothetical protein
MVCRGSAVSIATSGTPARRADRIEIMMSSSVIENDECNEAGFFLPPIFASEELLILEYLFLFCPEDPVIPEDFREFSGNPSEI